MNVRRQASKIYGKAGGRETLAEESSEEEDRDGGDTEEEESESEEGGAANKGVDASGREEATPADVWTLLREATREEAAQMETDRVVEEESEEEEEEPFYVEDGPPPVETERSGVVVPGVEIPA